MNSMFMAELEILEHEDLGPWFMEIKKKAFLEGAVAVLYELAEIPQKIKEDNSKIVSTKKISDWATKQIDAINHELNQVMTFELHSMISHNLPGERDEQCTNEIKEVAAK